jgi:hypothetical protein
MNFSITGQEKGDLIFNTGDCLIEVTMLDNYREIITKYDRHT